MNYILNEAIAQEERGVHILDLNVGLPEIDEVKMLTEATKEIQAVVSLPLQIDTSNPAAMESALRRYNGKAMINSVNGKEESMRSIFPLAKKYGGLAVALTLDENGIPEDAEGRFKIAKKILATARSYGIDKKDIIFDPLALTVSADKNAAKETLLCVNMIKRKLHAKTSLGVSNVSFGLPRREFVNAAFFTMAMAEGLSAAIMNPYSAEMMGAYHSFLALRGLDDSCRNYIKFTESAYAVKEQAQAPTHTATADDDLGELSRAIVKGLTKDAAKTTEKLIKIQDPLSLVNEQIIPALNRVGTGFENKTVYLPQLLMSAEAAKSAFEVIKAAVKEDKKAGKCSCSCGGSCGGCAFSESCHGKKAE
jgi:5-methyltetrahydrofolate--homocysteine methyltransferase